MNNNSNTTVETLSNWSSCWSAVLILAKKKYHCYKYFSFTNLTLAFLYRKKKSLLFKYRENVLNPAGILSCWNIHKPWIHTALERSAQHFRIPHQKLAFLIDSNLLTPEVCPNTFCIMEHCTRSGFCLCGVHIFNPLEKGTLLSFWGITGIEQTTLQGKGGEKTVHEH